MQQELQYTQWRVSLSIVPLGAFLICSCVIWRNCKKAKFQIKFLPEENLLKSSKSTHNVIKKKKTKKKSGVVLGMANIQTKLPAGLWVTLADVITIEIYWNFFFLVEKMFTFIITAVVWLWLMIFYLYATVGALKIALRGNAAILNGAFNDNVSRCNAVRWLISNQVSSHRCCSTIDSV